MQSAPRCRQQEKACQLASTRPSQTSPPKIHRSPHKVTRSFRAAHGLMVSTCLQNLGWLEPDRPPRQAAQGLRRLRRASRRCARWALLAGGPSPSELVLVPAKLLLAELRCPLLRLVELWPLLCVLTSGLCSSPLLLLVC